MAQKKTTEQEANPVLDYIAQETHWRGAVLIERGDPVHCTAAQAAYYVPHILKLKEADPVAKAEPALKSRKTAAED